MSIITVLAKVSGRAQTHTEDDEPEFHTTYLDVPILPTAPIQVGSRVRVVYLEPKPRDLGRTRNYRNEPKYVAYTSDIHGTVIGVRAMEEKITEFVLVNENEASRTRYAYMAVPHIEGTTVRLPLWLRVVRWFVLAAVAPPSTRQIPIEPLAAMEWNRM
ncbi:hypothetical protein C8Q70DRAFT_1056246 [Cubamyces menziesii]|uniref:Uncharacterized protein n=1 Tax=Trametes cubensis TaxID=1111947 RepID=A0AAD7X714_9APHY|nr:hypothetical protein C8Q70DRAFT_1056246 [Cubamyces menziesii]KAJ8473435.1 hypothetical protein ONZ51_g7863 [Trametes cubensis]